MTCANPHSMNLSADNAGPLRIVDARPTAPAGVVDRMLRMLLGNTPASGFAVGQLDTVAGTSEFDRMARRYGRLA